MRDRQLLAREVEYLREKILPSKESEGNNLYSSRKDLIDDIFNKINYLEKD